MLCLGSLCVCVCVCVCVCLSLCHVARDSAVLEISDYARGGLPARCSDIILIVLAITRIGTLQSVRQTVRRS
jgi:hypothetical protein